MLLEPALAWRPARDYCMQALVAFDTRCALCANLRMQVLGQQRAALVREHAYQQRNQRKRERRCGGA